MEITGPTIITIAFIIGTVLLVFKTLRGDIVKLSDKLSAFEKSTEHRLTKLEMEVKNTNQCLSTMEGYLVPRKVFHFEEPHKDEPKEN